MLFKTHELFLSTINKVNKIAQPNIYGPLPCLWCIMMRHNAITWLPIMIKELLRGPKRKTTKYLKK